MNEEFEKNINKEEEETFEPAVTVEIRKEDSCDSEDAVPAKTVSGELLQFPIRSMSAGEYMEYLHTVAKKFDMNVQMRSYLICTGNFKTALSLVNATPTEIRQLRMLYGSLEPFQRAMRTNLQHKHNLENEK